MLVQAHFAGAQKISLDPHSASFSNEFCSPEAVAFRAQAAERLSGWLSRWLQTTLRTSVSDGQAKLRLLFDDLQASEFFLEVRTGGNNQIESAIAIKLAPARARLWETNLKPFFPAATFKSIDGWLIFDSNPALIGIGSRLAQKITAPSEGWFDMDINWPRLAQWHPQLKELAIPETRFNVTSLAGYFNITGKFFFPENLSLKLDQWQIPTNIVHVPFTSFTAVRGFSSWLQSQPWAHSLPIAPIPNQIVIWSLPVVPLRTFASIPVPDAVNSLSQVYGRLVPVFEVASATGALAFDIVPEMSNHEIDFPQVPWAAMKLRAVTEPAGQFLVGELMPNSAKSKPLPPELYRRLETKGLVFYHYEATGNRIAQLLQVTQLGLMLTQHKQLLAESIPFKWVQSVGANLAPDPSRDHTDTEIVQSGPAEFTFTRKTPVIFTALEFYALANWLEAPNFPGFDIKLPPKQNHINRSGRPSFPLTPIPPPQNH